MNMAGEVKIYPAEPGSLDPLIINSYLDEISQAWEGDELDTLDFWVECTGHYLHTSRHSANIWLILWGYAVAARDTLEAYLFAEEESGIVVETTVTEQHVRDAARALRREERIEAFGGRQALLA